MRDNVLVVPVLEQEPLGNHSKLRKAKLLVEHECRRVCGDNRIELQNPEADFFCFSEAILHKKFADVLATLVLLDSVTCV